MILTRNMYFHALFEKGKLKILALDDFELPLARIIV